MGGMTRRRPRTDALPRPPAEGLAATTHAFRMPLAPKLQALGVLVALMAAISLLKGSWPPPRLALVVGGVGVAWLGLANLRSELSAGPGWIAMQTLLRRRWVRTDRLATVSDTRLGLDRLILLRDRDGRRVGVQWSELTQVPELRARLAQDVRTSVGDGLVLSDRTADLLGAKER